MVSKPRAGADCHNAMGTVSSFPATPKAQAGFTSHHAPKVSLLGFHEQAFQAWGLHSEHSARGQASKRSARISWPVPFRLGGCQGGGWTGEVRRRLPGQLSLPSEPEPPSGHCRLCREGTQRAYMCRCKCMCICMPTRGAL